MSGDLVLDHQLRFLGHRPAPHPWPRTGSPTPCARVLTPTYAADSQDAPTTLCAKLPAVDQATREYAQSLGVYAREVSFYWVRPA